MTQIDELLNGLSDDDISLYLADPSTEPHIVVGNDRYITVPDELKRIAVAGDHNVETVTFDCPRFWDGLDMSQMYVYINYMRPDKEKMGYLATNVVVDENDTNIMHFDWTIDQHAAAIKGDLIFLVCIKKLDEDGLQTNHWNSELCKELTVSEGLEVESYISEASYPSIITELLMRMENCEAAVDAEVFEELRTDVNTVTDKVNTMEIGGRNRLLNTKAFDGSNITSVNDSFFAEDDYKGFAVRYKDATNLVTEYTGVAEFINIYVDKLGDQYTLSFYAKGTGRICVYFYGESGYVQIVRCVQEDGTVNNRNDGSTYWYLNEEWTRHWVTWTLSDTGNIDIPKKILFRLYQGGDAYICGAKLEKGNVPTDWTPAPEDTSTALDEVTNEVTTNILPLLPESITNITIPTTATWSMLEASETNSPDPNLLYPYYTDITVTGITTNHEVTMRLTPDSEKLKIAKFNQSLSGSVRIYSAEDYTGTEVSFWNCKIAQVN